MLIYLSRNDAHEPALDADVQFQAHCESNDTLPIKSLYKTKLPLNLSSRKNVRFLIRIGIAHGSSTTTLWI